MVEMFKSAWSLIKVVWEKVKPFFELIFEGIKNAVKILADNLGIYFKTAWEVIKTVWSVVGAYFKAIFDTITGIFKVIKAVLSGDFKGAWEAIKGVFSSWGSFFKGLFNGLINIFANIGKAFLDIGKNIVKGIWDGISASFEWIKNKIKNWVGNVVKFIKKLFGIHSPSTVMRDEVGKYLAQGMGVGFDKELGNVYDDMKRAIDLETSKMTANVQTSGTYQVAMTGTPTFNLRDNSTNETKLVVNGKVLAEVVNTENRNREVAKA
jgi:phage-related protein